MLCALIAWHEARSVPHKQALKLAQDRIRELGDKHRPDVNRALKRHRHFYASRLRPLARVLEKLLRSERMKLMDLSDGWLAMNSMGDQMSMWRTDHYERIGRIVEARILAYDAAIANL